MATHSSILAWRIPWMEELGGLWVAKSQTRLSDFTSLHSKKMSGNFSGYPSLCNKSSKI